MNHTGSAIFYLLVSEKIRELLGRLKREGDLITFFPWKGGRGSLERGLFEGEVRNRGFTVGTVWIFISGNFLSTLAGQRADRGECPIDVILFAWGKDQLPSVKEIIEILHLNTNLHLHVIYETSERRFGEGDELGKLFKCRRQLPGESSFFETLPKVIDGYVL